MAWQKILFLVAGALLLYWGWHLYKTGSLRLNKADASKTAGTLGLLALFLIGIIIICIKYLRG